MKKLFTLGMSLLLIAMAVWFVGCSKEDSNSLIPAAGLGNTSELMGHRGAPHGQNGTTLQDQYVTMACYNSCEWTFEMATLPTDCLPLYRGECADVNVGFTATKYCAIGFSGQVCGILNGGAVATENLKITVTLLQNCGGGTGYVAVAGPISVDLSSNPTLDPGEIGCYDYKIPYNYDPNCSYKVNADITITNHSGALGEESGPSPDSPSAKPDCTPTDECATVSVPCPTITDVLGAAADGFTCSVVPGSIDLTDGGTGNFVVHICNEAALCEETYYASFAGTLTTCDTQTELADGGQICLSTVNDPRCPPTGGCTRTIGYWKTHAVDGLYGNNTDHVSASLPIYLGTQGGAKTLAVTGNQQVVDIMKRIGPGGSSNGILKLYAQMLGTKLSIAANLSDDSCVEEAIAAADAFLATHSADDWAGLSKDDRNAVLGWMSTFDQYNNGLLSCASHCE